MRTKVYLDETGDNGFNFDNESASYWFTVVGIIVEENEEEELEHSLKHLAEIYRQGGQIKSSQWSDEKKRSEFVRDLVKLNWRGYALVVDKRLLVGDGFLYKRTFYKRIPRQIYQYLKTVLRNADLYPDPVGSEEFQAELKRYILKKCPGDLFDEASFNFRSAKDNRITQLADFASGTLYRDLRDETNLFDALSKKFVIKRWPLKRGTFADCIDNLDDAYDPDIAELSFGLAKSFLESNKGNDDPLFIDQTRLLEMLIYEVMNGDPFHYLLTDILRNEIARHRNEPEISDLYFRTKVIGQMRSHDVIIVSNRSGGYKLPVSYAEVREYLANLNEKVQPMIERANLMANHIQVRTSHNILDDEQWLFLQGPAHRSSEGNSGPEGSDSMKDRTSETLL
ncbi:DUF3800 domain-containing protein [Verrucomicrobiota bacterium]